MPAPVLMFEVGTTPERPELERPEAAPEGWEYGWSV